MRNYAVRRLLLIVPTLLIASLIVAGLVRILPGDVVILAMAGGREGAGVITEEGRTLARAKLGLDEGFMVQYVRYILGWPTDDGSVVKSYGGGLPWSSTQPVPTAFMRKIAFASPSLGWGVGGRFIWGTTDGGRAWTALYMAEQGLNGVSYADAEHVWAVGDKGIILHSDAGGKRLLKDGLSLSTWEPRDSGTDTDLHAVRFIDRDTGWAVGAGGTILHTGDGGRTWVSQASATSRTLVALAFADGSTGWAVGAQGTVVGTTDGGASWSVVDVGVRGDLNDVAVAPETGEAWVVGNAGVVLRYGKTGRWERVDVAYPGDDETTPVRANLRAVAVGAGSEVFMAGDGGLVLRSEDGGASWARDPVVVNVRGGQKGETTAVPGDVRSLAVVTTSGGDNRLYAATFRTNWKWGIVGGNWGASLQLKERKVLDDLKRSFPPSFQLAMMTVGLATVIAIPLGVLSAVRQDTPMDYVGRTYAIVGLALPAFWLASMVLVFPAIWLDISPPLQYVSFFENPLGNLGYFALPVAVGGVFGSASVMRMTRSMMLEVLRQDYIRTAWSKGLRERVVLVRHALKNALIPVITIIGMQIPWVLGGQVVIERIFNVPGLGRLLLEAIESRDYPIIQGVNLFLAGIIVGSNLIVDLTYGALDPRIRYR